MNQAANYIGVTILALWTRSHCTICLSRYALSTSNKPSEFKCCFEELIFNVVAFPKEGAHMFGPLHRVHL